jgi:hypothetical protein
MKTTRQALRNGLLRSGTALSLAYLLVLQGLLASMAQGTWAAAGAGPLHVICTSNGIAVQGPTDDSDIPGKDALRWHCATLCQLAAGATDALLGARTGFVSAPRQQVIAVYLPPADAPQASLADLIAEARAPPSSI